MRLVLAAMLALGFAAACSPREEPPAPEPAPPAEAATATLSPEGYGPIRIGMTPEEASAAFGRQLLLNGEPMNDCADYVLDPGVEPQAMRFLAIEGRLARIDDHGSQGVATPEGIAVGASADAVRAAYPEAVEEPGEYDPPTTTLTVWTAPNQRGYRFHMHEGRVTGIAAGAEAIQLAEGCA